jgi:hypothetical protein
MTGVGSDVDTGNAENCRCRHTKKAPSQQSAEKNGFETRGAGLDAPRDVNHEGRAESQTNDFSRPCKGLHTGR